MKTWAMIVCMVLLAAPARLAAQQDDTENTDNELQEPRYVKVGGAGGPITSLGLFKNDEINKALRSAGMPELSSAPMFLVGGEGYGYIMFVPNFRIGGFGIGGSKSVSSLDPVTNVKKDVEYHISYGGLLIDYVVPVVHHLDIAGGVTIGAGSVDIETMRDNGSFKKWDDLWNEFGTNAPSTNVTRSLDGSFVAFNPHLNVEYTVRTWLQLRVGVGYPMLFDASWQLNNDEDLQNVPSKLRPDGVTVNAGIFLGLFN